MAMRRSVPSLGVQGKHLQGLEPEILRWWRERVRRKGGSALLRCYENVAYWRISAGTSPWDQRTETTSPSRIVTNPSPLTVPLGVS